jgi:uncharacterized membrane protein
MAERGHTPDRGLADGSPGERTVERLVQFSDGIFAVGLTLLVVDLGVPSLPSGYSESQLQAALLEQLPNVAAFALTFWVVALYWLTHHRHFRLIHRYDGRLMILNFVFLMTIVFIPWPTAIVGNFGHSLTAWVVYALAMAGIGLAATALWWYGSGDHGLADGVTPDLRRYYLVRVLIEPIVFLASIPIAMVSLPLGQYSTALILVGLLVVNRRYRDEVEEDLRPLV